MTLITEDPHDFLVEAAKVMGLPCLWGWEPTFDPDPCYGDDPKIVVIDENTVAIGYVAQQGQSHVNFWKDRECGEFKEFTSLYDRDEFVEEVRSEGKHPIIVDRYKHGNVHYSPANSRLYADRQWDVAPCGVFVPPDDVPEDKRGEYATSVLNEYSQWCNGEVYGIVVVTLTVNRETGEVINEEDDSCWEFIGDEHAKASIDDYMPKARSTEAATA